MTVTMRSRRLHCLSASTTFRTTCSVMGVTYWKYCLHCLSASTTFRTPRKADEGKPGRYVSSLPFGFNHVPHNQSASWDFSTEPFRLHCLSASTTFRTTMFLHCHLQRRPCLHCLSASTTFRTILQKIPLLYRLRVFIAFRLQPRSAPWRIRSQLEIEPRGLHCLSASTTFRTRIHQHRPCHGFLGLHCLSASTTFRTWGRGCDRANKLRRLHCLSASTTFRTEI